jgi:hypothetical protein
MYHGGLAGAPILQKYMGGSVPKSKEAGYYGISATEIVRTSHP